MTIQAWNFSIEVPLQREIEKFPFDHAHIELRLRPMSEAKARLVPDFVSYDILIPETKPGIDPFVKPAYWEIQHSFFSVDPKTKTNFNCTLLTDNSAHREISFHIELNRLSQAILVSYFLPIFIGSIMMFVVLMIPSDRSLSAVYSTMSYGGTIFFVITIFHVNLRTAQGIDSFTFLESYYIMQHVLVMLISLNGFFLMRGNGPRWIHYRNNLIPRVLYWPSLCVFVAVSAAIYFI